MSQTSSPYTQYLIQAEPNVLDPANLKPGEMLINMGPQHPSMHGVLRLEVITDGGIVTEVVPHVGYLHRCFEKHAETRAYNLTIPFVDRMDYLAAMRALQQQQQNTAMISNMLRIQHQTNMSVIRNIGSSSYKYEYKYEYRRR